MEAANETKFGTQLPRGWRWCPNSKYTHSVGKACNTNTRRWKI